MVGFGVWFMVGSDVWVVVGLWLKWVGFGVVAEVGWVGCLGHGWIGGLGLVDGGFETVNLLIGGWIGWVDHR